MKKKLKIYSHHICFDNTMRYKENLYMKFVQRYEFLLVLERTKLKSKCWLKLKKKILYMNFHSSLIFIDFEKNQMHGRVTMAQSVLAS